MVSKKDATLDSECRFAKVSASSRRKAHFYTCMEMRITPRLLLHRRCCVGTDPMKTLETSNTSIHADQRVNFGENGESTLDMLSACLR